jgi:hypothetical protein
MFAGRCFPVVAGADEQVDGSLASMLAVIKLVELTAGFDRDVQRASLPKLRRRHNVMLIRDEHGRDQHNDTVGKVIVHMVCMHIR